MKELEKFMRVCIIGWYGTETLGDRAILDGVFIVLDYVFQSYEVYLGSLLPSFTERTMYEDKDLLAQHNICNDIKIFDERSKKELDSAIENSDIVIMGGGPLMDIREIFLVKRAFRRAKKKGKRTILFGCGVGPLEENVYIECFKKIISNTDLCIFRDAFSMDECIRITNRKKNCYVLDDPAILSICNYKMNNLCETIDNSVLINMRAFPKEYGDKGILIEEKLKEVLLIATKMYDKVTLVPMHTFFIGGDDRVFLTKLCNEINAPNIKVVNKPLGLSDLYKEFMNAEACIGMRYHSIVMQTILNGNNLILDYTDSRKGKIAGFMNTLNTSFYQHRYINLPDDFNCNLESLLEELGTHRKYYFQFKSEYTLLEYKKLLLQII